VLVSVDLAKLDLTEGHEAVEQGEARFLCGERSLRLGPTVATENLIRLAWLVSRGPCE